MKFSVLLFTLIISMAVTTGCAKPVPVFDEGYQPGAPPPHMPAHGYRHKHENQDLRYDAALGVYVLLDMPDYYYDAERYYRYRDGDWQYTQDLDNEHWRKADRHSVPERLYQHYFRE